MNKESELVEMACILSGECKPGKFDCRTCSELADFSCVEYDGAMQLQKSGYGNVRDAVKEFCDELKEIFKTKHLAVMANVACNRIDELYKKLYGKIEGANDKTAT